MEEFLEACPPQGPMAFFNPAHHEFPTETRLSFDEWSLPTLGQAYADEGLAKGLSANDVREIRGRLGNCACEVLRPVDGRTYCLGIFPPESDGATHDHLENGGATVHRFNYSEIAPGGRRAAPVDDMAPPPKRRPPVLLERFACVVDYIIEGKGTIYPEFDPSNIAYLPQDYTAGHIKLTNGYGVALGSREYSVVKPYRQPLFHFKDIDGTHNSFPTSPENPIRRVLFAGEIEIKDGKIRNLSNASGHFKSLAGSNLGSMLGYLYGEYIKTSIFEPDSPRFATDMFHRDVLVGPGTVVENAIKSFAPNERAGIIDMGFEDIITTEPCLKFDCEDFESGQYFPIVVPVGRIPQLYQTYLTVEQHVRRETELLQEAKKEQAVQQHKPTTADGAIWRMSCRRGRGTCHVM